MFWRFILLRRNLPQLFSQAVRAGYRGYQTLEGNGIIRT